MFFDARLAPARRLTVDVSTTSTTTLTRTWRYSRNVQYADQWDLGATTASQAQSSSCAGKNTTPYDSTQFSGPPSLLTSSQIDGELVAKRRLGQTNLAVKPGQVGTSNATKPENLGPFDYAHLRAPLPRNLKGSEIFAPHQNQPTPEVYFLMVRVSWLLPCGNINSLTMSSCLQRRSTDGYVSATGMFKAAFPWAKHAEENAERDYVKSLPSTAQDEVAGNVWVSELYGAPLRSAVRDKRLTAFQQLSLHKTTE